MSAEWFEAIMLVCFGISWPVAIYKTWRTQRTDGKSLWFLVLVFIGYLAGILAKVVRADGWPESVTGLYVLNAMFVAADMVLYRRYSSRRGPVSAAAAGKGLSDV